LPGWSAAFFVARTLRAWQVDNFDEIGGRSTLDLRRMFLVIGAQRRG